MFLRKLIQETRRKARMSLHKFLTRLIWLCVLPLVLLAVYLAIEHVRSVQNGHDKDAEIMVQNFATAIDHNLDARISALQMLALSPLADEASHRQAFYREAQGFFQSFGSHIVLLDPQRRLLFNTRQPFGDTSTTPPQQKGRIATLTTLQTGQPAVGDIFFGPVSKQPMVGVAVPGLRDGNTTFVLGTTIEIRQFQDHLMQVALPTGWSLSLLDSTGEAIARTGPPVRRARPGDESARRFVVKSSVAPWSVALDIPREVYLAPLFESAAALALAILGATLASVIGGTLASRRLARSVAALAGTAAPGAQASNITEIATVGRLLDESLDKRDKAELERRGSEKRFRAIFEQAAAGIALLAPDGRWLLANQKLCDTVGYPRDELLGKTFQDITHPDDLPADLGYLQQMLAGEVRSCSMEKRYIRRDGATVWINQSIALVRGLDSTPDYFIALMEDIQRRKEAEAALQASEASLKEAQRLAGLGSWRWDLRTGQHVWSEGMNRIYGRDLDLPPAVYPEVLMYFTPDSWALLQTAVETGRTQGTSSVCDVEVVRADGSHRWVTVHTEATPDAAGTVVVLHGTVQDITERKLAADELTQHRQHLEQLVSSRTAELSTALADSTASRQRLQLEIQEHKGTEARLQRAQVTLNQAERIAQLGAWSIELHDLANFNQSPSVWSAEMYRLLDYTPADVPLPTPEIYFVRVHPDDRAPLLALALQALAEKRSWHFEYRLIHADGSERLVLETGDISFDEGGKPRSMHGAVKDITAQRHIENQLRDSEARLRLALEAANAGTYELDIESGESIWMDDIWSLFGLPMSSGAACYETWQQAVHPDDLERIESLIGTAIDLCADYEFEWRVNLPYGAEPRWLLDRARPVLDQAGRLVGYRGIVIDISKRKQAELTLDLYSNHLEDRVAERTAELTEAETEQRRLNRALRLLSDCNLTLVRARDEHQLLGDLCRLIVESGGYLMGWVGMAEHDAAKTVRPVAQSGYEQGYLDNIRVSWDAGQAIGRGPIGTAIRTGSTQVNQGQMSNPQMEPWRSAALKRGYQSSVALPLIFEDQVLGALSLYSDKVAAFGVQEEQLLEELASNLAYGLKSLRVRSELENYQQQLEELVAQRTQEIAALNTELAAKARDAEAANRAKGVFLATMSHELRTPLNAVVGLTGLLADSSLNRSQRDYADKILLSAQALRALMDDILDFSRIEAGALRLEQAPFSLNAILRTTAAVVGVGLRNKPIEALFDVAPDVPDALIGDALRLQQILLNLTSNAVKFTEAGEVLVSVRCRARDAGQVTLQFAVRDTGIGIPAEQLGPIFDSFIQADTSTSRLYGGSGLGLTISARLARLMGGQIGVDSTVGLGSEFHLDVPLALGVGAPVALSPDMAHALNILIVDDHAQARAILMQTCAGFGWQASAVDSGAAALAALRRSAAEDSDFDLMLLDWRMPDLDGLAMLRQAYATPDIRLPLVVLMASIFELEQAVAASDDLHLDGVAAKPMTPASLLEVVTRAYSGEYTPLLAPPGKTDRRLAGMRLLVAEDNELNQEVIEQVLSRAGAEVVLVATGLAAVATLRPPGVRFDAVLMDIQMPVMDGYAATRIIREELGRVDLPIIAVTAFARPEDREKSRRAGMAGHLVKPLDVEDLLDLVARERQASSQRPAARPVALAPSPLPTWRLPGLDVGAALQAFGGDQTKYQEILRKFLARHGGDAIAAHRLFDAGDAAGAAALLHGLSGMAALLQATEITRLAAAAEVALHDGTVQVLPFLFEGLDAAMRTLGQSIDQLEALWADA
jgi:hypothetical protein